jgi:purine-binding chemotaxis protein CheW
MEANHYMEYLDDKRRFVIFEINAISCAIDIIYINEIIAISAVIPVNEMMSVYVDRVKNLRGVMVPLINLRQRFIMERKPNDSDTAIIIIEVAGIKIGLIVDCIVDVITLRNEQISDTIIANESILPEYIEHTVYLDPLTLFVLSVETIVDDETFSLLIDRTPSVIYPHIHTDMTAAS